MCNMQMTQMLGNRTCFRAFFNYGSSDMSHAAVVYCQSLIDFIFCLCKNSNHSRWYNLFHVRTNLCQLEVSSAPQVLIHYNSCNRWLEIWLIWLIPAEVMGGPIKHMQNLTPPRYGQIGHIQNIILEEFE